MFTTRPQVTIAAAFAALGLLAVSIGLTAYDAIDRHREAPAPAPPGKVRWHVYTVGQATVTEWSPKTAPDIVCVRIQLEATWRAHCIHRRDRQ